MTTHVNKVELKRAILDGGASINIMPLTTFQQLGILEKRIVKSSIAIIGFKGDKKESMGYVVMDLAVGVIRLAN